MLPLMLCPALAMVLPGALDPCALITVAEATAAMGVPSQAGLRHSGRAGESCRFYSPDHQMNVFVKLAEAGDLMGARQLGGKTMPGIGDEAVWAGGTIFIRKGAHFASVGLYLNANSMKSIDPQLLVLGKAAAGRM